jgi:hypothetical protein
LARNKAIFDADILINMIKTESLEFLITIFEQIYVSDYVWNYEIRKDSSEFSILRKMKNKGLLEVIDYQKLSINQQQIYKNAYKILKKQTLPEFVNEGEIITASYAKAHNIFYYMSDDNKAAPFIRSIADVEVVNFCDLLFIAYSRNENDFFALEEYYSAYISLFEPMKEPKCIKSNNGDILSFQSILVKACNKFEKSAQLKAILKILITT